MRNITRATVATLALASLLGLTACTSGGDDKPSGFKGNFTASSTVPADWQGSSGWAQDKVAPELVSVHAIGDKTGYLEPNSKGAGFHLTVVDGDGKRVYSSKDTGVENVSNMSFAVVKKDGKPYWVFSQTDGKRDDNPGLKKTTELVIVDETGKEVASKTLENTYSVTVAGDGILSAPITSDMENLGLPTKIFDASNGAESPVPTKEGHRFAGRYDGVDLFSKTGVEKDSVGTVTNGTWSLETATTGLLDRSDPQNLSKIKSYVSSAPVNFGNLIQVRRSGPGQTDPATGEVTKLCDLVDVHTGELGTNAGGGQCVYPMMSSPDGQIIYFENEVGTYSGIIVLKTGKTYTIGEKDEFVPTAISDNGDVYGKDGQSVYSFNILTEDAPKKLDNVVSSPSSISKSGLAAFVSEGKIEFITKKEEKK